MTAAKKIIATTALICSTIFVLAQPPKNKITPVQKFKPPVVKTMLGNYADSVSLNPEEAIALVSEKLRVADGKINYTIASYQFAYKRVTVSEDETTGRAYPSSDMIADVFKVTPLPAVWQNNIKENLKKGELLYFFDVTVKDTQGRLFFAPELKIHIQ